MRPHWIGVFKGWVRWKRQDPWWVRFGETGDERERERERLNIKLAAYIYSSAAQ